jgi:hypothetical protein
MAGFLSSVGDESAFILPLIESMYGMSKPLHEIQETVSPLNGGIDGQNKYIARPETEWNCSFSVMSS